MMRKLILFLLFSIISYAQVPQKMSHRGTAYNTSGAILQNTSIIITVNILDANGGTSIFNETHNFLTNNNGQYNINIGEANPTSFSNINWSSGEKWLKIEIAPSLTPTNKTTGSSQLISVPYALYANSSKSINSDKVIKNLTNINELKLFVDFNPDVDNVSVYVEGYNEPGDGGGGNFIFKRYSDMGVPAPMTGDVGLRPIADDGAFFNSYHSYYTSHKGMWMRIFQGSVDVRYYGVFGKGGDLDHTSGIQKAIDYCGKSTNNNETRPYGHNYSNEVYLPNGDYNVSKLILKQGVTLRGTSKFHTRITAIDDDNYALIVKPQGEVRDISIRDITFLGTKNINKIKDCFNFDSLNQSGGLWESTFKNINIYGFTGNSIYLAAGITNQQQNYSSTNQFLTFENVSVESVGQLYTAPNKNPKHALEIYGSNGQFLFNNCRFDGGTYLFSDTTPGPDYMVNGIPVLIHGLPVTGFPYALGSNVISFNVCSFQNGEQGLYIDSANCININTCWFEFLERAVTLKGTLRKSVGINISNSNFLDSAGKYGDGPSNSGVLIAINNALATIQNNFIINSDATEPTETSKFVYIEPNNNGLANLGVNVSNNYFDSPNGNPIQRFADTWGVKKEIDLNLISGQKINIENAKTIFLKNATGTTKIVDEISSSISVGEFLFVRADQGNVKLIDGKNIYLGGMNKTPTTPAYLELNNGGVAVFVKVEETLSGSTYNHSYNLISFKLHQ